MVFELGRPPWTKSVSFPVTAAREWRKIQVPFEAAMTYPAGEAKLNFRLGFAPQTVELGGITVESFGTALAVSALPVTRAGYRGHGARRQVAQERRRADSRTSARATSRSS